MNFRIVEYEKGFVAEVEITKRFMIFWTRKDWVHFISVSGIDSEPWHHSHPKYALSNTLIKVRDAIYRNSDSEVREKLLKQSGIKVSITEFKDQ